MVFDFLKSFKGNNEVQHIESKPTLKEAAYNSFLDNMSKYVAFHEVSYKMSGINLDEEGRKQLMEEYSKFVSTIVNYLNNRFPDAVLDGNNSVDLSIADIGEELSDKAYNLLLEPQYPSIMDVKRNRCATHFHISEGKVTIAECVEALPNLDRKLAKDKINRIFEGLTVEELAALLHQMHILPRDNDIDKIIVSHKARIRVHNEFLDSVIYMILSNVSTMGDIRRARLFADIFGVSFDFEPYENLVKQDSMKLTLGEGTVN